MELTYQGLKINIPLEGLVSVEEFKLEASFNKHVSVELSLIAEEEKIEPAIHGLADNDGIEVYENDREELLFAGKIIDAQMVKNRGLCCLNLKALSYTMDWDLVPVSQSFLNLDATYKQVMDKVLENQPGAEIKDCVTDGAVIPDFLLQYEESDWDFLARLASCFGTFLVPDCRSDHGRAYFGIPDLGDEYVLDGEDYQETKDMDRYYRIGCMLGILSQEHMGWEVTTGCDFSLGQKVRFKGINTIVTSIQYCTVDGELVRSYKLNREKGVVCPPRKNPHIYGMSIPATVKERSGNCVKVHFHIDSVYDTSPHVRYFTYAIESSFIYCMPEVGSQVHIYFPSDDEKDAVAVHAVRTEGTQASGSSAGYAQKPDYKSFSNVNGAELLLAPEYASMSSDQENKASVSLDVNGFVEIKGKNIEISTEKSLSLGEATEEGGSPAKQVALEAGSLTFQVGEAGTRIELTEEAKIIAAFVKMEATDTTPADNPTLGELFDNVTAGDEDARNQINDNAKDQLVTKYEEGRKQILRGLGKIAAVVATVAVAVVLTVATGGAALGPMMVATYALGAASIGIAVSDIGEGVDNVNKAQSGNLDRGHNFLRDDVCRGNELLYNVIKTGVDIAFGIVSGKAIGNISGAARLGRLACGSKELKTLKAVVQMGGNVISAAYNQYVETGKVSFSTIAFNMGLGFAQGFVGTSITNKIMGGLNIDNYAARKITQVVVGTFVDTGMDWVASGIFHQPFDPKESFARNAFANTLAALIADPVDAVTGIYVIHATDFLLSSLPSSWKLERSYYSTGEKDSVFGRGWSFPYASRIYQDTQDTENIRVHMETITGHSVCFEKQGDVWVNQCRGTSRFSLIVREDAGCPEQEVFLLTDVMDHTLCAYDRQGKLSYVEYPNRLRLLLSYNEEGLQQITTPLGNVLEVECRGGRILQVTDEIGRRTQYRYAGEYLIDVVHTDEGITHYEYDENGHIVSVTDQNGSRYIENEYDEKGRIARQGFTNGIYQIFTYDDVHRRNTIYYSETGKTEIYEYNDQLLKEKVIYDDGTCEIFAYSDDNMKIGETSRSGHKKEWEYDAFNRTVREQSPDGYEVCHEYDKNHDLVRTWDTDGRDTRYTYDDQHNQILIREKLDDKNWRETAKAYDSMGRCIVERDALGNETLKEYDSNRAYPGRVTTPKGEETVYSYDAVGRRISVSNSYGTVEMAYNSRNFVTSRTDGEGYTSHKFYDRMGNLTAYYPPVQWEKKEGGYEYRRDFLERVVDTISPMREHQRVFRNFDGEITNKIHPVSYAEKGEDGEGTRYEYDADGNCIRIYYPDGGIERRFYDADGSMIKQVQPESYDAAAEDGAGYCYAYDSCGRLTEVYDPEGNTLHTYEYNGHGQVTREVDGEGKETLYTYNGLGWKTKEQISARKEGDTVYYRVIAYRFDNQGNKVEESYGQQEVEKDREPESWHTIHFSYDSNNHLTLVQDDFGAQMRYDYDCLGNIILEERVIADGIHSIIRYAYNKNGWRIQKTEEIQGNGPVQSAVTKYSYDANGNLTKIVTPKGFVIRREYDVDDRLTEERVTDRKSGIDRRVQYAYDEAGNIRKRTVLGTDGECLETGLCYDLKDRLIRRTNPGGAVLRYLYDRNDQLIKAVSPYGYEPDSDDGAGTTYAYDSRGNRIRVTNAFGEMVQESAYNLQNQPVMQKDSFGNRTAYSYELDGQVRDVRRFGDGKWNESAGDSSASGEAMAQNAAVSQSNGNGQRTIQQFEYNARGQIVGVVDGNRNPISYDVDSWGRIMGIGFANGIKEGYEYTSAGQVSRTTDGNGNSVQYRYNSFGKVSERTDQMGYTETFQYDEEGNLSLHIDRDGRRLQRDCNVFGKPVYEKATDAEGNHPNISTWHYDSLGRVIRAVCDGHSYEYVYDAQGNLKEKRSSGRRLISYAYDKAGQVTEIKDPAGVSTRYEYDILGRRSRIYNNEGLEVCYGYDALNRISHIRYGNGVETAYAYDGDGNLSCLETKAGENILLSFAYQYDGNGNRTAKVGSQARAVLGGITEGSSALDIFYHYDVRGQLLEERRNGASICYTYDKAGNRVRKTDAKGATLYQFNRKNQLIGKENHDSKNQFTYDRQGGIVEEKNAAGIRLFSYNSRHQQTKVETENGNVQENRYDVENLRFELLENGRKTSFVYYNGELLHEEGGDEHQSSYHLGAGIDALQRGQELSYYHRDEQLSTAYITGGNGEIQNSYLYDAFGTEVETNEQFPNHIRYTGQQYDELTEQYYLRARYYNPVLGRFMQEDSYQGDGLNLYAYCRNNPVTYYDPSGYEKLPQQSGNGCGGNGNIGNGAEKPEDMSEYTELSTDEVRDILRGRGLNENQINDMINSFDGPIYQRTGYEGQVFTITESNVGDASGIFVTRGSAGATPEERIDRLALPPNNTANVESQVELNRTQILLEGKVAGQPDWAQSAGDGIPRNGGAWQVVTDGGKYNDAIRR